MTDPAAAVLRTRCAPLVMPDCLPQVATLSAGMRGLLASLSESDSAAGQELCGLAANQVGVAARLFLMRRGEEMQTVVNPVLLEKKGRAVADWEGCLSVPGVQALVPRAERIRVAFYDESGREKEEEMEGFEARVFLHELDHVDGVLFIQRVPRRWRRRMVLPDRLLQRTGLMEYDPEELWKVMQDENFNFKQFIAQLRRGRM